MQNIATHYLYPAELFAEPRPYLITTILGSCVAVCLFDNKLKIGGINHYMLPLWNGRELASPRFGNIAIEKLIDRMIKIGCHKEDLTAKVFGGSEVLNTTTSFNIGTRNAQIAFDILKEHGILVTAKSTGGQSGRKIIFNSYNNEVQQKYLSHGQKI